MMARAAKSMLPSSACMFTDVLDLWGPSSGVSQQLQQMESYEDMLATAWRLPCLCSGWCSTHERFCPYADEFHTRPRIQGPPCPDWSAAGQRKGLAGVHMAATLAGARKASWTRAPLCVVENVPGFPDSLVADAYGPEFSWTSMRLCPDDVGFEFIARERQLRVWVQAQCA